MNPITPKEQAEPAEPAQPAQPARDVYYYQNLLIELYNNKQITDVARILEEEIAYIDSQQQMQGGAKKARKPRKPSAKPAAAKAPAKKKK
jgi:hypothetical protein